MTGINLIKDFIPEEQELALIKQIDEQEWLHLYQRRVQHYGYLYEYRTRGLKRLYTPEDKSKGIPSWLVPKGLDTHLIPEQIIVNEYLHLQGITPHTDACCFGPVIASLSLGADTVMTFEGDIISANLKLPRRSLLVLSGKGRYKYKHSIKHAGDRRVSITYRTLALGVTSS